MVIFFDIDDTLVDHTEALRQATHLLYERLQLPIGRDAFVSDWHRAHREYYPRFLRGDISYQETARARVRAAIDTEASDQKADEIFGRYLEDYEASWVVLPDALPCLKALRCIG